MWVTYFYLLTYVVYMKKYFDREEIRSRDFERFKSNKPPPPIRICVYRRKCVFLFFIHFHTAVRISIKFGAVAENLPEEVTDTSEPYFFKFRYPLEMLESPPPQIVFCSLLENHSS
jgi:hypothetical protein